MPNKAITNAKRKRAGALGSSSRFYNISGKQVAPSTSGAIPGGQGWAKPNPSIGSILSLGIAKQNKNAGGNNVCSSKSISNDCKCRGPSGNCPCRKGGC